MKAPTSLLSVRDLNISLGGQHLVRSVDLDIEAGQCLALVGESGSGKSLTALSLMRLLPRSAKISQQHILFEGQSLAAYSETQWRQLRARRIAMIFQNPMTAMNPTMRVGQQIAEVLCLHAGVSRREANRQALALLERLGIVNAAQKARQYPFEMSGGMLQRAVIAMAIACKPALLIADEPTTALDATVQAEVLVLLRELCNEQNMGLLLITHDLGVVRRMAQKVAVMYAGKLVETGDISRVFNTPAHPYTQALKQAMPSLTEQRDLLMAIPGTPPDLSKPIAGCAFAARCPQAMNVCARQQPADYLTAPEQHAKCWLWDPARTKAS